MDDKRDKIRERAHEIWESEGRPHGAHDEHWRRAQAEHDATHQQADAAEGDHHEGAVGKEHLQRPLRGSAPKRTKK
ncbi:DUF2934 domain-containing protein [Rhizobium sp. S152]|uniref:DUF2934 domain-containing protein n=1 Tax=Rhizobium sp. S152 TaxID=3055038 RepID=UPI003FA69664